MELIPEEQNTLRQLLEWALEIIVDEYPEDSTWLRLSEEQRAILDKLGVNKEITDRIKTVN